MYHALCYAMQFADRYEPTSPLSRVFGLVLQCLALEPEPGNMFFERGLPSKPVLQHRVSGIIVGLQVMSLVNFGEDAGEQEAAKAYSVTTCHGLGSNMHRVVIAMVLTNSKVGTCQVLPTAMLAWVCTSVRLAKNDGP